MKGYRHSALAALLIVSAGLLWSAQAQTPAIVVTTDKDQVRFAVSGEAQQMCVKIFSPGGELILDSGTVPGQAVEWKMQDQHGGRVPGGVYFSTILIKDAKGKTRKHMEQIAVSSEEQHQQAATTAEHQVGTSAQTSDASQAAITGAGATGKIAKWSGPAAIGNSIITEGVGKIGVGTTVAPTAVLQVNGAPPAASTANGINAPPLLQTSGGKGGNTTAAGRTGGTGASISLVAGNGGDAPAGSTKGAGGSIIIQPGAAGGGAGQGGANGNVLLSPVIGNVGIGTFTPASKLTVSGMIQMTGTESNTGIKFFDGSVQKTAAIDGIRTVTAGAGLSGGGTSGDVTLSVAAPLRLSSSGIGATIGGNNGGSGSGLYGSSSSGNGVYGTGITGVKGVSASRGGIGVHGMASGIGNSTGVYGTGMTGVKGVAELQDGTGVQGIASGIGDSTGVYGEGHRYGIFGKSINYAGWFEGKVMVTGPLTSRTGIHGFGGPNSGVNGSGSTGVSGSSTLALGVGVKGYADGIDSTGVHGEGKRYGIYGKSTLGHAGWFDGQVNVTGQLSSRGVTAISTSGIGVSGSGSIGVSGSGSIGVSGDGNTGVTGSGYIGVSGSGRGIGVEGTSSISSGVGVQGTANRDYGVGVKGTANGGGDSTGVYGEGNRYGVFAKSPYGNGVYATGITGVKGVGTSLDGTGVQGVAYGAGRSTGVRGEGNHIGVFGMGFNYAGFFQGRVTVTGNLTKGGGSFKIDHPLDPANKYLSHSFVESPDMMNIYNGNLVLDERGEAAVTMPQWFDALNRDFRYQLTAIGAPGPNLYIAEKMKGNQFRIAGGKPGMEVSWQVTGIRRDAYANAHRIRVEEEKSENERGSYLHPELFGQPQEKNVERAKQPTQMPKPGEKSPLRLSSVQP